VGAIAFARVACRGDWRRYYASIDKVFVDGPLAGFGTFVLFWTLSYNCCHSY